MLWQVGMYVSAGSLVLLLCRSVPGRAAARVPFETPWGGLAGTSKGPAAPGWLYWGCQREVIAITIQHIVINLDFLHPPRLLFVTDPRAPHRVDPCFSHELRYPSSSKHR